MHPGRDARSNKRTRWIKMPVGQDHGIFTRDCDPALPCQLSILSRLLIT